MTSVGVAQTHGVEAESETLHRVSRGFRPELSQTPDVGLLWHWQVPSNIGRFWRIYVLDSHGAESISVREVSGWHCWSC